MKKILLIIIVLSSIVFPQSGKNFRYLLSGDDFSPKQINGLQLWFDATKGVSTTAWLDQSGNSRTMTLYNSPTFGTQNGKATVIFNGSNQYGKCSAFTLSNPITIYIVFRQITWTATDYIFDGNSDATGRLYQYSVTPTVRFGDTNGANTLNTFTLNTFALFKGIFTSGTNNASLQMNNGSLATFTTASTNMGGFTLARAGTTANLLANIEVCEVLVYNVVTSTIDDTKIKTYLYSKWGITP